ncbi:hypothetical protein ASG35_24240 [Burkholderia sp. Leaf177]|uniref:hypothetical protein n=1 Tax=Burkholderia sp. Leaf177 TaxID=1736287 RepID=UPI0006F77C5B|nr:hypothetical protein [Burkholderia sp. Leaf177]KQR87226.1 hypothetical protein ASG35_24240 [Burkholderia sp. Leaf177]
MNFGQGFTLDLAFGATVRSMGVALGDLNLVQENLSNGALVAPFERVLESGSGYYLVHPPRNEYREKSRPLLAWLQKIAAVD